MCTYNGGEFLHKQLYSFLSQTKLPDELIICDDRSSDNTLTILEEFKTIAPFKVEIYINNRNLGARANFFQAIDFCNGDLIFLADQDDIWMPHKIMTFFNYFESHPNCLMLFSNAKMINISDLESTKTIWDAFGYTIEMSNSWNVNNTLSLKSMVFGKNYITGACSAIKKQLIEFSKPTPDLESLDLWHDAWLGICAAALGELRSISEPCIFYRIHEQQQLGLGQGKPTTTKRSLEDHINKRLQKARFFLLWSFKNRSMVGKLSLLLFLLRKLFVNAIRKIVRF